MSDAEQNRVEEYPFRPNHITVAYPPAECHGYGVECLIAAINEQLADYTVSCSIRSDPIQASIKNPHLDQLPHLVGAIQFSDYDLIDWSLLKSFPNHTLFSSYPIRKALIRKNYLIKAIQSYHVKNKSKPAAKDDAETGRTNKAMVPKSYSFRLSYSDELDELWYDELYDLNCELEDGGEPQGEDLGHENQQRNKIWILKPALADKGQGIRLFRTREELYEIFREFERIEDLLEEQERIQTTSQQSDDQDEQNHGRLEDDFNGHQTWVSVSQMRDWIIQEYISNPLLIDPDLPSTYSIDPSVDRNGFHKHHLRVYVLAVGALSVYVFEDMLSLFSSEPYTNANLEDLRIHLTNTCLQDQKQPSSTERTRSFNTIHSIKNHPKEIIDQIHQIVRDLFAFVAQNDPVNLQLNLNCFEIFGLDFLIDNNFVVWLLEINSGPDFSQTGPDLKPVIERLFQSLIKVLRSKFSLAPQSSSENAQKDHVIVKRKPDSSNGCGHEDGAQAPAGGTPNHPDCDHGFKLVLDLQTQLSGL